MRALVAEENNVNRAALRTVLERRGFVVDEIDDSGETSTLESVAGPTDLAILSAQTVLLDFAATCAALRAANPDIYIAALLESDRVHEAVAVLEAGANDFLVSSPLLQELDARLSVICSQLYQYEPPEPSGDGAAGALEGDLQALRRSDPSAFDYAPIPQLLTQVVRSLGFDQPETISYAEAGGSTFISGWFAVVVRRGYGARWINLRFDFDRSSIDSLFRATHRNRTGSSHELERLVEQFLGLVRDGLEPFVHQNDAFSLHFPIRPHVFVPHSGEVGPIGPRTRVEQRGLKIHDDIFMRLTASLERCRTVERAITQLTPMDVLATPIESGGERTLLREGIMLDDVYINRIQRFAFLSEVPTKIFVFRPPGDTALFLSRK